MFDSTIICEETQAAVEEYVEKIKEHITSFEDYTGEVDVGFDPCLDSEEKLQALQATITTDIGVVVILPVFSKKSAVGTTLNIGLINGMRQEGFEDDFIFSEGLIYTDLLQFNTKNTKTLAYYLTHKLKNEKRKK